MEYGSEYEQIGRDNNRDAMDCTVIAVSIVTSTPYAKALAALAKAGRKKGGRLADYVYHGVIREMGFTIVKITNLESKTVRTLERELAAKYGKCKVMVNVKGHVLVWNGMEVVDWSAGKTKRIKAAYLVYPGTDRPMMCSVVPPVQKSMNRVGHKRSGVEARIGDDPWVQYRSVKAAYEALGFNLKGHQHNRKYIKHYGEAEWHLWRGTKRVKVSMRLSDMSRAVAPLKK